MTAFAKPAPEAETFYYDRDRSPSVMIRVSHFAIDRDAALRSEIARMIRKARRYMRSGEGCGTHWSEGFAGRVIEWALSLKPEEILEEASGTAREAPSTGSGTSDDVGIKSAPPTSDPVVTELVAAHRARKAFPAGHTFAMTNPVINGHMVTLGTCSCGDNFSYPYGSAGHERMDAAIEAHWQKFDSEPDKVDGRGQPIQSSDGGVESRHAARSDLPSGNSETPIRTGKSAGRKPPSTHGGVLPEAGVAPGPSDSEPGAGMSAEALASQGAKAGGHAAPLASAPQVSGGINGADAVIAEDWSPLLTAALDLAWREPPEVNASLAALLDFSKVYGVGREVDRPVVRWHGGKWLLAPWIISHFPPHRVYVEPFGGAGSVLMRKPRAYAEIWNDLDDAIVNLFQVLRSPRAHELVEHLRLTPFARSEFNETSGPWPDDPVERARHLVVRAFMGFGSNAHGRSTGFRANSNRSGTTPAHDWANYPESLLAIIERVSGIVVENRDAIKVMETHDSPETLHYVDPPYVWATRGDDGPDYSHEMDNAAHDALLAFLPTLEGMVVLSGYPSAVYNAALPEWRRIEREALADGARPRTEVLWLNPACAAALDQQMPTLFDLASFDAVNTPPLQNDGG